MKFTDINDEVQVKTTPVGVLIYSQSLNGSIGVPRIVNFLVQEVVEIEMNGSAA